MGSNLEIKRIGDGQAAASALEAGNLDMAFHLPVQTLDGLRQSESVTVKSFPVGYQYMMWHNMRKPHMSDVKVRKALDMTLDRAALTQEVRGGLGTRSFFPKGTPYYVEDDSLHADKSGAATLLDEAGWVKNANGIREKAGVQLTLDLVAYPQRPGLVTIQPLIKQQLAALGIVVNTIVTSSESWDELDAIIADKNFDLLLWAQHTLPAGDPQWFINAFFRSSAGNNLAGLNSTEIDGLIDDLSHAGAATRVAEAAKAHRAVLEQVPVSIVMTPAWHVGLGPQLSTYTPWGSDYYVIHADFGLPETTTTTVVLEDGVSHAVTWAAFSRLSIASILLFALMFQ